MEPILNELSVEPVEGVNADDRMLALVGALKALGALGAARTLRSTQSAVECSIAPGVPLRAWAVPRGAFIDEKRFLSSRLSKKAPFVEDLHARAEETTSGGAIEVRHLGRVAMGLGAALFVRSVAVSLIGLSDFACSPLPVVVSSFDGDGQIHDANDTVLNVWDDAAVARQQHQIVTRILSTVANGAAAWDRRVDLFGRIDWSVEGEAYLRELHGSEPVFHDVIHNLVALSQAAASWSDGPFEPLLRFSVESTTTLEHPRLGPQRDCTFGGNVRRLTLHLKLQSAWRIYYEFHEETPPTSTGERRGRVIVGYVGPHLRTSSDLG